MIHTSISRKPVLTFIVYYFVTWFSQVYQGSVWLKFCLEEGEFLPPCEIFASRTERSHLWRPCGPTPASSHPGTQMLKPQKLEMLSAQGMGLQSRATQASL